MQRMTNPGDRLSEEEIRRRRRRAKAERMRRKRRLRRLVILGMILIVAAVVGAGILMASATASITAVYPDMAAELSALASTSETLSGLTGIYVAIFVGIPLCRKLYTWMEPKFAKLRHEPSEVLMRKEEKVEEA